MDKEFPSTNSDQDIQCEPLIDAEEIGKRLSFSSLTIKRWAHQGKLPCIAFQIGTTGKYIYRFRASELANYLKNHERKPV